MSSVNFSHAKDAELAWLDGEIHFTQTTSSCPEEGGDNKEGPVLGPISSGPITTVRTCVYVYTQYYLS